MRSFVREIRPFLRIGERVGARAEEHADPDDRGDLEGDEDVAGAAIALAGSAALVHVRHVGAQLFVRGLWGAALVWSTASLILDTGRAANISLAIAAGALTAMVAAGRRHMGRDTPCGFQPKAYRTPLVVALGIAAADAMSLFYSGLAALEWGVFTSALPLSALLAASVVGLYRMRAWGVLTAGAGALTVGVMSAMGALPAPRALLPVFLVTSIAELLALAPLLKAAAKRLTADDAAAAAAPTRVRIGTFDLRAGAFHREAEAEAEAAAEAAPEAGSGRPTSKVSGGLEKAAEKVASSSPHRQDRYCTPHPPFDSVEGGAAARQRRSGCKMGRSPPWLARGSGG